MDKTSVTVDIAGKALTLETGQLAKQATASVLARLGDTMVLVTVVAGKERPDLGYFPLSVEYVERLYAGGRIKGSRWVKREGRPSDEAIIIGRIIDRSIRPLFPKEYKKEVQVVVTLLSVDGENEPDILAIIAVSSALAISPIPWNGPIGAVRMGLVKEHGNGKTELVVNPGSAELDFSELNMVVSQTREKTVMVEAEASQVSEEIMLSAIEQAQKENRAIIAFIEDLAEKVGQRKEKVYPDVKVLELTARIEKTYRQDIASLVATRAKKEATGNETEVLIEKIFEDEYTANPKSGVDKGIVTKAVEKVFYEIIKDTILRSGKRPDGRKIDEVRPISAMVSVLPRTHGSAIFSRGNTQALTVVTLGSPRLEQLIESAEGEESKRYIHHYSMPPYSVGEAGRMGVPSRREIGHGALAERALLSVIPKQDAFPYTIRVVSEILSSNGSTSMAATCGSTLALMDAGVPISNPVAGIAMGMMSRSSLQPLGQAGSLAQAKGENYLILSDILGLEDFSGDMDFKVAGTKQGITAIQLDVKIPGLTITQVKETLTRAKEGRLFILEKMLAVLSQTRQEVSAYAPKIAQIQIPVEKIGEVIGPGGRVIRGIMADTNATVDVEDNGIVTVSGATEESVQKASDFIRGLTREVVVGETFEGPVKRILPFGAFVEILPGKEGMVHVSKMSSAGFVRNPSDVVAVGQKVKVKVVEIDEQGRVNLSMILSETQEQRVPLQQRPEHDLHPLARQFRRERAQAGKPGFGSRDRSRGRFRKPHY
ncbi:MAG: polyribonucleotide nucleotidyltransferase [Candidatus Levybacteria bacterium]|nr:polyribonucleotide nucleotidyltransferase [Candidatus Levybacteria bacterium]